MRLTPVSMPWARSPLQEPLSLTDAKAYLKVDHTDEDALITQMVREARSWVETFTGRALIDQTWKFTIESFPTTDLHLPKGKTIAITGFIYRDTAGVLQSLYGMEVSPNGSNYQWDLGSDDGGLLRPAYAGSWPDIRPTLDPIQITFRAGYSTGAGIPEQILAGLKWKLADLYAMRGNQDIGLGGQHQVAEALLIPWKLGWF